MVHDRPPTARQRRHQDNRRRILDTALGMVERGGPGALSIHQLAEAVDYTPGALYRYFGSKNALLAQLIERVGAEVRGDLERALARLPPHASPLAAVLALVDAYRAFAAREPHRFGLLAVSLAEPKVLLPDDAAARAALGVLMAGLQPMAEVIAAAQRRRLLTAGDARERTLCLFALLQGLLPLRKQARHAPRLFDIDRLAVRGACALLCGWGARRAAVVAAARQLARRR